MAVGHPWIRAAQHAGSPGHRVWPRVRGRAPLAGVALPLYNLVLSTHLCRPPRSPWRRPRQRHATPARSCRWARQAAGALPAAHGTARRRRQQGPRAPYTARHGQTLRLSPRASLIAAGSAVRSRTAAPSALAICAPFPPPCAQENVTWKEQWIATRLQKAERENATVYLQAGFVTHVFLTGRAGTGRPGRRRPSYALLSSLRRLQPRGAKRGGNVRLPDHVESWAVKPCWRLNGWRFVCAPIPLSPCAAHPPRRGPAADRARPAGQAHPARQPAAHRGGAAEPVHLRGARQQVGPAPPARKPSAFLLFSVFGFRRACPVRQHAGQRNCSVT